ncbi:MAG: Integral rane protein [Ilumatobacteraceae bacterium]|nr:Integral rane protein [Ilumatobacteraceae bacterium]
MSINADVRVATATSTTTAGSTSRAALAWRVALAVNAVAAGVALAIKFAGAATTADPQFPTVAGRVFNELCYFTIQSNLVVIGVCCALAWRPERWRWVAGAPRLAGLVCITVTGVVYYSLLAADQHLHGIALVGDVLAHAVSPVLFVGTWLLLGPRGRLRPRHVRQMLAFPVLWIVLTLLRGATVRVYPYDFVDVGANGYAAVFVTVVALTAAATALAAGAVWFDRRRAVSGPRRRPVSRPTRPG